MKPKYKPCCGVKRTPDKGRNMLDGGELRVIVCHDCGLELRYPVSIPEYRFSNAWNDAVSEER